MGLKSHEMICGGIVIYPKVSFALFELFASIKLGEKYIKHIYERVRFNRSGLPTLFFVLGGAG